MESYISQVRTGVLNFLESVRWPGEGWGRFKYHRNMMRPYGLISSHLAISTIHRLGALKEVSSVHRQQGIVFIQSCQDAVTGYLKDPLVSEADHDGPHTWEQIYGQMSGAENALILLGGSLLYPAPQARFADFNCEDAAEFTRRLDWSDPWIHGESWSRAIKAYLRDMRDSEEAREKLAPAFHVYETEILDPITGFPQRGGCQGGLPRAMAGLFKVMMAYQAMERPVPYAEVAIDSTLSLQLENGEFGYAGNMCMNWDALWILHELSIQLDHGYRFTDIREAGNRCVACLLAHYRKEDGGFAFHGDRCMRNHHSIRLSRESYPISDTHGTSMCVKCLEYADEWNA